VPLAAVINDNVGLHHKQIRHYMVPWLVTLTTITVQVQGTEGGTRLCNRRGTSDGEREPVRVSVAMRLEYECLAVFLEAKMLVKMPRHSYLVCINGYGLSPNKRWLRTPVPNF